MCSNFFNKNIPACLFLLIIIISSCSSKESNEVANEGQHVIKIDDLTDVSNLSFSKVVDSVFYLPLETSEEVLMGQIESLQVVDERIFVSDITSKSLFSFDMDGRLITKYSAVGEGPGEFSTINSFTINPERKEVVIAGAGKILFYDYEGEFLREFKTVLSGSMAVAYTGNNRLMAYTNYKIHDEKQGANNVVFLDYETGDVISANLSFNPKARVENMTSFFNNISGLQGTSKYLSIPYRNTVWQVSGEEVDTFFTVDFGDNALPDSFEDEFLSNSKVTSGKLREIERNNAWYRIKGGGAQINNRYVNFSYAGKDSQFIEVFFDKRNDQGYSFKVPLENDIDGAKFVVQRSAYENYFISIASPEVLLGLGDKVADLNILGDGLEIDGNPVLRFVAYNFEHFQK
ncbi:6-bladed beta-propeller protein [Roseivirga pacifica]|uniref:6-bladed beta-propeller protein n=1 Tax=Roseivirga pacifica TaxID=1267423 RepID=A0A1I0PZD3_9BACT|nr:6-bladed beta-propeller [Roseivirga pacifica]RKQ43401.1 6-bladed beta-propeller protein [Roseivirga pacifica]SEW19826.1 6-bladed beta-propeller protein [Roseivirga pacifica]